MKSFSISGTLFLIFILFLNTAIQAQSDEDLRKEAIRILEEVPLIDGHNDVPWQYRNRADYKFSEIDFMNTADLEPPMHTDIPRLLEGRVGGQFWSVYVSANTTEPESVLATMEQIDFVYRMIEKYPNHFELALTADDVERIFKDGKIASIIGMEGGHSIANSLAALRQFYHLGARYMTITHSRTLDWVDSATDDPVHDGLSLFGEEVIREMNRLGMIVDLSHVSTQAMRDAIRISEAPVIFSHSSARTLSDHSRNVPDDVIESVRENEGVIMVTYVTSFVSEERRHYFADRNAEQARLNFLFQGQPEAVELGMESWDEANPAPEATLQQVADHIDYIREIAGIDYIGIGGDYDGVSSLPVGLEDVSTYPDLFAELLKRGYSEDDLKKIAGLNVLRVMRSVEATADRLQKTKESSEALISDFE